MADERTVKARFEVETAGEREAFDDAAEGIDRLAKSAAGAAAPLGDLAEKTQEAGESAPAVRELGDAYDDAGGQAEGFAGKGARLAGVVENVIAAFELGYTAGTAFRGMLAAIDEEVGSRLLPTLDDFVRESLGVQKVMDELFGPTNSAAEQADELRNILSILAAKGIQPVSQDLDDLRAQLQRVAEQEGETARETEALQSKTETWAKSLGLSRQELDETAKNLASFVETFQEQNQNLDASRFAELVGPQIREILDAYRTLGTEAPPEIQKVAEALGVVDSAASEVLGRQQELIRGYVGQLREALGALPGEARENAAAIQEAFKDLSLEEVQFLSPEQQARFKETFEEMVASVRAAGGAITPEMVAIGSQVGVLLTEMAPLSPETERIAKGFESAGKALRETSQGAQELGTSLPGEALGKSAEGAAELARNADEAASKVRGLGEASAESADAVEGQGQAADRAAEGTGRAAEKADQLAKAQDQGAQKSAELGENLDRIAELAGGVERAASTIAESLGQLGKIDVAPTLAGLEQILGLLGQLEAKAKSTGDALAAAIEVEGGAAG